MKWVGYCLAIGQASQYAQRQGETDSEHVQSEYRATSRLVRGEGKKDHKESEQTRGERSAREEVVETWMYGLDECIDGGFRTSPKIYLPLMCWMSLRYLRKSYSRWKTG